jgi:Zn-finger nucleic acid-binding protein
MAYLNCPTCRLTVYSPEMSASFEECPRCRAKLGKVSRLFRSALPPRLQEKRERFSKGGREETASTP